MVSRVKIYRCYEKLNVIDVFCKYKGKYILYVNIRY